MSLLALVLLIAGFVLFTVEAVRSKSLITAGLAVCDLAAIVTFWPS